MTRVLIVDDNQENAYYLAALLGAQGDEVDTARHGVEALAKARSARPDLVISDLLMPVMDGYTLLRHWKTDPELKQVPFIIYTATYTDPDDEKLALSLGADAFILKPSEPDAFLARLSRVKAVSKPARPALDQVELARTDLYQEYSQTLIRKLEDKSLQLEQSNRALATELSERARVEAALRESEARFRQLAESIDDVFWLCDLDNRAYYYVSPAYERVWGRSCDSLYAAPGSMWESIHPEDRERLRRAAPRQSEGGWDETYRIVRPDGEVRVIRARAFPVRDQGQVVRVAGVSRDITEQRKLEEQLRQAQKMEAVGRLAGGVAHDFNNILFVILNYAHMALDLIEPDHPVHEALQEIRRAGERASGLTRQLLSFSRQHVVQPRVLDLGLIVLGMENMLRRLGEDLTLSLHVAPDTGKVYADPTQIEQVIMNLAVNARDAMPAGGELVIETANAEIDGTEAAPLQNLPPGSYVMLSVRDTGTGMDAATQERMFEPFFTTKPVGKGTGLGLSTVYGIVKQSAGYVTAQSELGKGTTFRIFLPSTDRLHERHAATVPPAKRTRGSETVLLVEDDAQVRAVIRRVLEGAGYHVLEAKHGADALRVSQRWDGPMQLLLTDVVMPGMSGRELAERLGATRPELRVLYVSGYTEDAILRHGVLDAGIAYLQKPIPPDTLLHKLREVLDADDSPVCSTS